MSDFSIKDYRASHILLNFINSRLQGWYTRENILRMASHPLACGDLVPIKKRIDSVNDMIAALQPGSTPFLANTGTVNDQHTADSLADILLQLFEQYANMNRKLNDLLNDEAPLHTRKSDVQYIVACLGWTYYCVNNAVRGDLAFAERFDDSELSAARAGHMDESAKELEFIDFMVEALRRPETYNPETCGSLDSMISRAMDTSMRDSAMQADKYLTLFGK
jgi:hypothetical protein